MTPTIGITCSFDAPPTEEKQQISLARYVDAVAAAGGAGDLLWWPHDENYDALARQLAERLDGLILSGGADLPAEMYGEEPLPDAGVKLVPPQRPAFEAELLREFTQRGKPVFGICYGCQFMNVWRGGSLVQDIPLQLPHAIVHRGDDVWARHEVRIKPDSLLHQIVGLDDFECVSSHHQAMARVATDATATSLAPDGVVESIEFHDAPFFWGVQWHPECDPESVATKRIFAALVAACSK